MQIIDVHHRTCSLAALQLHVEWREIANKEMPSDSQPVRFVSGSSKIQILMIFIESRAN